MAVAEQPGQSSAVDGLSYTDLYRRWELHGQWQATQIDFTADRAGWAGLSEIQRKSAVWLYSMFLAGEDSVAVSLAPYIDAAPTLEQKYFLTTQQVDEARHAVFFHRFFTDVIGSAGGISDTVAASRIDQSWGYRRVFERLDRMADELRRDRSLPKFAQAIALYTWSSRRRSPSRASTSSRPTSPRPAECRGSWRGSRWSHSTSSDTSASA
jgi:hypothetical protein